MYNCIKTAQRYTAVATCCPPPPAKSAVVGVDKTFDLGPLHATVTAYKNLSIKNRQTRDHPIFIGPIFHHGDADSFLLFLQHLAGILSSAGSPPLSGQMRKRPCEMLLCVLFLPPAGWFANYTRKKNLERKYR